MIGLNKYIKEILLMIYNKMILKIKRINKFKEIKKKNQNKFYLKKMIKYIKEMNIRLIH